MSSQTKLILVVALIASLPVVCALGGMGIGWIIGTWMPEYYRHVFRSGTSPQFNPLAMGMGLGLSQGVGVGVMLALVAGIVTAWWVKRSRIENRLDVLHSEVHGLHQILLRLEERQPSLPSLPETAYRKKVE